MDTLFIDVNGRKIFCKDDTDARVAATYYHVDHYLKNWKRVDLEKKRKARTIVIVAEPIEQLEIVPIPEIAMIPEIIIEPIKQSKLIKPVPVKPAKEYRYNPVDSIPDWTNVRKRIIKLDDYVCRICFDNHDLNVHHIDYSRRNNEDENLVTLCGGCHRAVHNEGYKPELYPDWPVPWKIHRD